MRLTTALAHEFSKATRARGDAYADAGAVTLGAANGRHVDAVVRGTRRYSVEITRHNHNSGDVGFEASCECPYAVDELTPCKHIWATLNIADRLGHLLDGPDLHDDATYLDLMEPSDAELTRRAATDEDTVSARLASPRAAAAPSSAQRLLTDIGTYLDERDLAPPPVFRYATGELMYAFDVPAARAGRGLALHLLWRQRKKSGEWSKPKPATMHPHDLAFAPERDRRILGPLFGASRSQGAATWYYDAHASAGASAFLLPEALVPVVVPAVAATGRAFLRLDDVAFDLVPLTWDDGPAWTFAARVERLSTGYRLSGLFERPGGRLAASAAIIVLNAGFLFTRGKIAKLTHGLDFALVTTLANAGPVDIPERDAPALAMLLARSGLRVDGLPDELRVAEIDADPTPRLAVHPRASHVPDDRLAATITFDYAGSIVPSAWTPSTFDAGRRQIVRRRREAEDTAFAHARDAGFRESLDAHARRPILDIGARQFPEAARTLLAEGWHVEAHGRAYRSAGAVHLSVSSGIDWFDLDATVEFGDARVRLTDVLAALKKKEHTVRIGDGTVGLLPEDWLQRYGPLAATGEVHDGRLRFRLPQTLLLDALLADREATTSVTVDETFARARDEMQRSTDVAAEDPPASFHGTLRDYQRTGLGWFRALRRFGLGGCLADDMGLGKTVMVLALFASRQEDAARNYDPRRPSVVVVPRSLVHNWMAEATKFAPSLRVLDYSSGNRQSVMEDLTGYDVALVTYGTLRRDVASLKDVPFDYVVLDEAQAIKNAATASAKAVRLLQGRYRLALSGTPIENHLGELWSLFDFLNPGLLGASSLFQRATTASRPDAETVRLLARGLRPFILRRTKAQVARELPAKTEQTLTCELSAKERETYDGLRAHFRDALRDRVERLGMARSQIQILEALLRLRQAACHPGLADPTRRNESSAKLDLLIPRLMEVAEEGHKALVFSQFTSLLAILRTRLDAAGVTYEYLDGRTRHRGPKVERFQTDPACPLFLISLKAGGLGLNLTAAEYVFLLDPWWNPAVEAQAIDRTHRIGQTREVFAYRIIAEGTVEEKVVELQQRKRALADAVLGADAVGMRGLSREDLELLLS